MPELPEVETVKRELEKEILNKTFLKPKIFFKKLIQTDLDEYIKEIENKKIISLSRKGKFLLIHLNNDHKIVFHLRMEGKLFVVNKNNYSTKHLSMLIPFTDDNALAFYDTRKFGVSYYLKETDLGPLIKLGLEPEQITNPKIIYDKVHNLKSCIKEILLDQSIIAGLGNIYADETLFASSISPFKRGNELTLDEVQKIINNAQDILNLAIINNGSTIRTYQASKHVHGSFQDFLKVYSKNGNICPRCNKYKIEKIHLNGRGTHFCPKCQNVGLNIGLTGLIASGKTTVMNLLKEQEYKIFNADEEVKKLYKNNKKELIKLFPEIYSENVLDKNKLISLLINDSYFYKKYEQYIFKFIKERMFNFIINNNGEKKVFEIPLLFNAHLQKYFTYIIGVESKNNLRFLESRSKEISVELEKLAKKNKYFENEKYIDFIIKNNGDLNQLKQTTLNIINKIEN